VATKNLPEVIEGAESALRAFVRDTSLFCSFRPAPNPLLAKTPAVWRHATRGKELADILEDLNRTFRRVRQESIDEELFDVISGFEALTGRRRLA